MRQVKQLNLELEHMTKWLKMAIEEEASKASIENFLKEARNEFNQLEKSIKASIK